MIKLPSFLILFFLLPSLAVADAINQPSIPSKNPSLLNGCPDFKFSGYLDGSYNYLVRSNRFTSGTFNRVYDTQRHGLTFHQLGVTLANQPKQGFGGLLNVIMGRDANVTASYGWKPNWGPRSLAIDPLQAYLQESIGPLTIIGGKFNALAGIENPDPTSNTNFSSGILSGLTQPTAFMGFRGTYAVNDKFNFILGINNGWDNIRDTSRHKTFEVSSNCTFNSIFSLAITGSSGGERAIERTAKGPKGIRNLVDILATITINDKLTFVANFDYGRQSLASLPNEFEDEDDLLGKATWAGIACYINYQFNECWKTSIRGEIFDDHNGFLTGARQTWKEITLTLGYEPIKNLGFRAEIRRDFSNVRSFVTANGQGVRKNQQSFALEAFYKFP